MEEFLWRFRVFLFDCIIQENTRISFAQVLIVLLPTNLNWASSAS